MQFGRFADKQRERQHHRTYGHLGSPCSGCWKADIHTLMTRSDQPHRWKYLHSFRPKAFRR
jgi:hypothetical protein